MQRGAAPALPAGVAARENRVARHERIGAGLVCRGNGLLRDSPIDL